MTSQPDGSDALSELATQNGLIMDLLDLWEDKTARLRQGDSVEARWERGSAAKLLLQHLAVRETAKRDVVRRLDEAGSAELAAMLEGAGPARRQAIDRLDETTRGHQAINTNNPPVDAAVAELDRIFRQEAGAEGARLLARVRGALGDTAQRDLPGARSVRMRAATHPNPTPRWYDRIKVLAALHAFYDHLRSSPSGLTGPGLDQGREHTPGPRS